MSTHGDAHAHAPSRKEYVATYVALLSLTALTVYAAGLDLGRLSRVAALAIAGTKATLVVLFFMHVRHASALVRTAIVAALLWIGMLFFLTLGDFATREWFPVRWY